MMFTDCLLESFNPAGEPLSLDRVSNAMRKSSGRTVQDALNSVLEYRKEHAKTDVLPDDLAVVCIEVPDTAQNPAGPLHGAAESKTQPAAS
ncbi:MAG: SpoIIE family protein phosphatase [Spirochaetia bacterium]|nr:SpoIIE family protein phosphatase [Spirochaetia bacterium]